MKHLEEDDIVKGWKDYFHRMNERDGKRVSGEVEEEDDRTEGRLEGRTGVLKFTADEYTAWCLPWMNSLIIKVLGASFPTYIIRDRINRMWQPKDPLKIVPLSNGYYIVSFSNKEDRDYAFQEGPWMIEDHYLIFQRWRPNFNPWKADLQCHIAAWICLSYVPFEFYNVESLHRFDNMIGKMIKVDRATSIYDKGGFARICVEIDLQQPLIPSYTMFGEERPIVYEGLHQVCFQCGRYGHRKEICPMKKEEEKLTNQQPFDPATVGTGGEQTMKESELGSGGEMLMIGKEVGCDGVQTGKRPEVGRGGERLMKGMEVGSGGVQTRIGSAVGGGATIVTRDGNVDTSPFGKIQILRCDLRRPLSSAGLRYDDKGRLKSNVSTREKPDFKDPKSVATKKATQLGLNSIKLEFSKDQGSQKDKPDVGDFVTMNTKKDMQQGLNAINLEALKD
ncbi:hypothetical protein K1719_001865 [Acacia pycnantha]|nr:hypothetical protein K1719_001865 [Acacia pycnantha]